MNGEKIFVCETCGRKYEYNWASVKTYKDSNQYIQYIQCPVDGGIAIHSDEKPGGSNVIGEAIIGETVIG